MNKAACVVIFLLVVNIGNLRAAGVRAVRVVLPASATPVEQEAAQLLARGITERCGAKVRFQGRAPLTLELKVNGNGSADGFAITDRPGGGILITGNNARSLLTGVGRLIRDSSFAAGGFAPTAWRGKDAPASRIRGVYLATHFGNFYDAAPLDEIRPYLEDLAVWGYNAVIFSFPTMSFDGFGDPAAQTSLSRIRDLMQTAKSLGFDVGVSYAPNQGFRTAPAVLRAPLFPDPLKERGNYGVNIDSCNPGGHDYLIDNWKQFLHQFHSTGLDYIVFWPYDEGGSGSTECWPWGARGFPQISMEMSKLARGLYPRCQIVLSTWMYDTPPAGEWEGLAQRLAEDKSWADYIMADAHDDFPRYPLEHAVPGNLPLLNFPEISMWGMAPWGGFGASPLPAHLQRLWDQVAGKLDGGFLYSEGVFEDINKVIYSRYYWDPSMTSLAATRDYISFYYSPRVVDKVARAIEIMEQNHHRGWAKGKLRAQIGPSALEAERLMQSADAELAPPVRQSWRWRILFLRAQIDAELYRNQLQVAGPVLKQAFDELNTIYHAQHARGDLHAPRL